MKLDEKTIDRIIRVSGAPVTPSVRRIVRDALEAEAVDIGNSNSGNYGHKGRPGQVGGSGGGGGGGGSKHGGGHRKSSSSGSSSKKSSGSPAGGASHAKSTRTAGNQGAASKGSSGSHVKFSPQSDPDYTMKPSETGELRTWKSGGEPTENLPNGSGTTIINEADVARGANSVNKYLMPDGSLTPEREALHKQAVNDLFTDKPGMIPQYGEQPTLYFLGGGSASGKGSFTNPETCGAFGLPSSKDVPTIDADEFKKAIPEYRDMTERESAAKFAHEESSAMAKRAMSAAFQNGYNCTLDGTGDGSVEGVKKKIAQARAAGYKVEAAYATVPTEMAISRSMERAAKTGRTVPKDQITRIHKSVSQIFPQVASEFDHVRLYDTRGAKGSKPVLVAECYRGQEVTVHDPKLYQEFLDKGKD